MKNKDLIKSKLNIVKSIKLKQTPILDRKIRDELKTKSKPKSLFNIREFLFKGLIYGDKHITISNVDIIGLYGVIKSIWYSDSNNYLFLRVTLIGFDYNALSEVLNKINKTSSELYLSSLDFVPISFLVECSNELKSKLKKEVEEKVWLYLDCDGDIYGFDEELIEYLKSINLTPIQLKLLENLCSQWEAVMS